MARRRKLEPFSDDPRDPLELMARMLVSSSYRVPVEGRSSRPSMTAADISAAVGLMADPLEAGTALAVATRANRPEIARLAFLAYRRVLRNVRKMEPRPVDLRQAADRWRVRMVTYDAVHDLVWPEQRRPYAQAAKDSKMRAAAYVALYRAAHATMAETLATGRRAFSTALWGRG